MKSVCKLSLLIAVLVAVFPRGAMAAGGGATFKEGVNYIAIKPALIVNYGGPGRVKYIKAEMSLRTEDAHNATEVTHHMPLIRDTLIMLISSVTDEQMASAEGKEKMRLEALAKINEALLKITQPEGPNDTEKEETVKPKKGKDKAEKGDKKKEAKSKDADSKDEESEANKPKGPPVSDLLFDNLVVQK